MKALLVIALIALCTCNAAPIEVVKCVLNSDIIFKAIAKVIEAVQTKNMMTIVTTVMSLYPKVVEEIKKCLAIEQNLSAIPTYPICVIRPDICINKGCQAIKGACNAIFGSENDLCKSIPC